MKLYLVQHGEAVLEEEDSERPLSEKGRKDVQSMAGFLARSGVKVIRVVHSGKKRALETAVLLADVIGPGKVVEEAVSGLAPNDSTDQVFEAASAWAADAESADVMVVGHQPFMGRLVARMLTGSENVADFAFRPGTVACLESSEDGRWTLNWMARPDLLGL